MVDALQHELFLGAVLLHVQEDYRTLELREELWWFWLHYQAGVHEESSAEAAIPRQDRRRQTTAREGTFLHDALCSRQCQEIFNQCQAFQTTPLLDLTSSISTFHLTFQKFDSPNGL